MLLLAVFSFQTWRNCSRFQANMLCQNAWQSCVAACSCSSLLSSWCHPLVALVFSSAHAALADCLCCDLGQPAQSLQLQHCFNSAVFYSALLRCSTTLLHYIALLHCFVTALQYTALLQCSTTLLYCSALLQRTLSSHSDQPCPYSFSISSQGSLSSHMLTWAHVSCRPDLLGCLAQLSAWCCQCLRSIQGLPVIMPHGMNIWVFCSMQVIWAMSSTLSASCSRQLVKSHVDLGIRVMQASWAMS